MARKKIESKPKVKSKDIEYPGGRYRCKVKCFVAHRAQLYEYGEIETFAPGEYVPLEYFERIEDPVEDNVIQEAEIKAEKHEVFDHVPLHEAKTYGM